MSVHLDVPWVTQLAVGYADPTGCWYASACMVAYYFEAGPRYGVPELYKRVLGDGRLGHYATGSAEASAACPDHHDLLAQREGLAPVPNCATAHLYTLKQLEGYLNSKGPIFMYWTKTHGGSTYGHASVIVGTDDAASRIAYHDPEFVKASEGADRKMSLGDFNSKRQKWKYALMQRRTT